MIYRPESNRFLWDSWLFPWKEEYHLFFLESLERNGEWVNIGHAVSDDMVHWQNMPSIKVPQGQQGNWDEKPTLTGMVVRHENRFCMFYGASSGGVQRIGLMHSDDLIQWTPYEANPVLEPMQPHYMDRPDDFGNRVGWRDPCINWRKDWQAYEALVCAQKPSWDEKDCGACIARCRSKDLINWEHLPLAASVGMDFLEAEVPDYFELNNKHYLLFSTQNGLGHRLDTPTRKQTTGVYYLIADNRDGEYKLPKDPLLLGSGCGRKDAYVGRTIEYGNRRLLYHHMYGDRPTWGSPKLIGNSDQGVLFLEYWPGTESLEMKILRDGFDDDMEICTEPGAGTWAKKDNSLIGHRSMRDTAVYLAGQISDFHLVCTITLDQTSRAGIIFRRDQSQKDETRRGTVFSLNAANGMVEWGRLSYSDIIQVEDEVKWPLLADNPIQVRILARNEHIELYLNNRWVFSAHTEDLPQKGKLGFSVQNGNVKIDNLLVKELEPLE
jgi:sucrose-6-phosphate hydrolase SacC (GH32 family)